MKNRFSTLLLGLMCLLGTAGGAQAQTNFVPTQTFSGTAGADINTQTNWVRDTSFNNTAAVLTASLGGSQYMRASVTNSATIYYYNTISPSADVTQTFVLHTPSAIGTGGSIVGAVARFNGNNGYYDVIYYTGGTYTLYNYKLVNGANSALTGALSLGSLTASTAYTGTFKVQGNTLTSTFNGVTVTSTDNTFTAAGYSGLYAYSGDSSPTDASELAIGNLSATTLAYTVIATTDTNLYWSGNWDPGFSGLMVTASAGAYLKAAVTGTNSLALPFTPPTNGTIFYKYSVNNGPLQTGTLTSSSVSPLFLTGSIASSATNTLWFDYYFVDYTKDMWGTSGNAPAQALQTTGLRVDAGGATASLTSTTLALKAKRVRTQGDSITQGCFTEGSTAITSCDATHSWGYYVAQALQGEWANQGYAGIGWNATNTPANNVPIYGTSWNRYNNAHAISFATPDNYLIVNMGTNNGTSGILSTSTTPGTAGTVFAAQRAAEGAACEIVYFVPFDDITAILSNLKNDLSYYGGGTTASNGYTTLTDGNTTIYTPLSDPNFCLIDLGVTESTGLTISGSATQQACDGEHPLSPEDARKGALEVHAIKAWEASKTTSAIRRAIR